MFVEIMFSKRNKIYFWIYLLSFCNFLVVSADKDSLSIWSCKILAQFFNWSMIFHGVVMATHSKTVVSVKFSSVKANLNKCECEGSPSSIQWPSLVWSEKEKNYKKLGEKSKKKKI